MGYRHSRDEILDAAVAVALADGMAALTFGKVGDRLGISDRTVVYYFGTKPALVTAVVERLGGGLTVLLEQAFGSEPKPVDELVQRAWPVLTTPAADRVFALFFEMVGLASAGQVPYDTLTAGVLEGWAQWLTPRVRGSSPDIRRRRALAAIAQLDGLLLLRRVAGADVGDAAARGAGIRRDRA